MRGRYVGLAAILAAFLVLPFSVKISQASEPGIGIGIRKEGPLLATLDSAISYTITVYNTGDFWIRNVTIIDLFPNLTSTLWKAPDLAPQGAIGDSFVLSNVLYVIRVADMLSEGYPHVINHAETSGYVQILGVNVSVSAETNYVTFISIPVGGFSVSLEARGGSGPVAAYAVLLCAAAVALPLSKTCRRKVLRSNSRSRALKNR